MPCRICCCVASACGHGYLLPHSTSPPLPRHRGPSSLRPPQAPPRRAMLTSGTPWPRPRLGRVCASPGGSVPPHRPPTARARLDPAYPRPCPPTRCCISARAPPRPHGPRSRAVRSRCPSACVPLPAPPLLGSRLCHHRARAARLASSASPVASLPPLASPWCPPIRARRPAVLSSASDPRPHLAAGHLPTAPCIAMPVSHRGRRPTPAAASATGPRAPAAWPRARAPTLTPSARHPPC
ncbi:hypothetical protein VPH35_061193 [Triticum aestivum]|nr:vegetative cell wall protein gp1-like [Aegilops tauschii subsp. strangulata]